MVVLVVEKATSAVRGELSRWLIEPKAGVFVGNVSAMVRDKLWEKVMGGIERGKTAGALLLHSAQNEQGFSVRVYGETKRDIRDWEGLTLVFIPKKVSKDSVVKEAERVRESPQEGESESSDEM